MAKVTVSVQIDVVHYDLDVDFYRERGRDVVDLPERSDDGTPIATIIAAWSTHHDIFLEDAEDQIRELCLEKAADYCRGLGDQRL